ncbi:sodium:proton antiporter [candidate division KSB1 bacterium]|nr:sodium:proton antiporter [candidate division KSB1 bacterium]
MQRLLKHKKPAVILLITIIAVLGISAPAFAQEEEHAAQSISIFFSIPFVLMLGSIAVIPLKWEHWWEDNNNKLKIALFLGIPVGIYFLYFDIHKFQHTMEEYTAFIIYVGSLFIISGGIVLRGEIKCSPKINLLILGIGTLLASFIGTPGASMLLIRPLLRINAERKDIKHLVIFFIFTVSNIGGCLTPLGDPPLFLGYLEGVPFTWTFQLWPQWLFANSIILAIFYFWDSRKFKSEELPETKNETGAKQPLRVVGLINFVWLLGVVMSVAFVQVVFPYFSIIGWREVIMILMIFMSLKTTKTSLREENQFSYHPVLEVAYLFIGIFLTMMPALVYLETHGSAIAEKGLAEPWMIFWFTGILSAFLDNAPTYLTFFTLAQGMELTGQLVAQTGITNEMLRAISLGAVFMGALTYIGNGPNFMVKAIADESGTKMPSFLGYMGWSFLILMPIFIILTFLVFILEII